MMKTLAERAKAIGLTKAEIRRRTGLGRNTIKRVLYNHANHTVASRNQVEAAIVAAEAEVFAAAAAAP